MKLIFLNRFFHPDHSATSQILSDLAFHLAKEGWEVHVVTSGQHYDDSDTRLPARETIGGVEVHRVQTTDFRRSNLIGRVADYLSFYAMASLKLLFLTGKGDVVVAKTDPPLLSVPAGVIAFLRRAKLVNWLQDLFPEIAVALDVRVLNGRWNRVLYWLRNRSLQYAKANVVVGEQMAEALGEQGIDEDKINVIPNWSINSEVRPMEAEENDLRRQWGLDGAFVVGYSGNLGRAHEIDTFTEMLEGARDPTASQFVFIGGGYYFSALQEYARERGLDNIHFHDYQPRSNLCETLNVPDVHLIFLKPELEGLLVPCKFYGIAAAGRPTIIVGDPEGEVGRIVDEYECGATIASGDSAGLAEAIERYRLVPGLCRQHGRNAQVLFQKQLARKYSMKAWCALLDQVMTDTREWPIEHPAHRT